MSYVELTVKKPKARKEHACEWCGQAILIGEKYLYRSYIFDGYFKNGHMHLECETAMYEDMDVLDEGWSFGSNPRGIKNEDSPR